MNQSKRILQSETVATSGKVSLPTVGNQPFGSVKNTRKFAYVALSITKKLGRLFGAACLFCLLVASLPVFCLVILWKAIKLTYRLTVREWRSVYGAQQDSSLGTFEKIEYVPDAQDSKPLPTSMDSMTEHERKLLYAYMVLLNPEKETVH